MNFPVNTNILLAVFFAGTISMGASCCKKDEPAPKNEPYDEMEAKIEGILWKSCKPSYLGGTVSDVSAQYFVGNYLDIQGKNSCTSTTSNNILIYIKLIDFNGIGSYYLGNSTSNTGEVDGPQRKPTGNLIEYKTDSLHSGIITITDFDTITQEISGTFQFVAFNNDSNKVITVTDGKLTNVYYYKF